MQQNYTHKKIVCIGLGFRITISLWSIFNYGGNSMRAIAIKEVSKGDFIKRKSDSLKVYIKGDYDRSLKGFWITDYFDISHSMLLKGNKIVFNDFEF